VELVCGGFLHAGRFYLEEVEEVETRENVGGVYFGDERGRVEGGSGGRGGRDGGLRCS
jgi:hypothetical protein